MALPPFGYADLINRALSEDISYIDLTTNNLIPDSQVSNGILLARESGILCGLDIAVDVFRAFDPTLTCELLHHDGDTLEQSDIIGRIQGKTRALLSGERTALNILQHLSGVASATHRAVAAVTGTGAAICDTRMTMPGMRALEKYAVSVGGGQNTRFSLSDAAVIKNNHIDAVGSIRQAVETLRKNVGPGVTIKVEARTIEEFTQALESGADLILLSNMSLRTIHLAVSIAGGRVPIEVPSDLDESWLREIAAAGVNLIAIGALTSSAKALDIAMKLL